MLKIVLTTLSNWWNKTIHQRRVEKMMILAGQSLPDSPTIPSLDIRKSRARLVLEEALELVDAMGLEVNLKYDTTASTPITFNNLIFEVSSGPPKPIDIVHITKELADCSVVVVGTMSAFGIPDKTTLKIVDLNNLEKFGPGGYLNEHGKWVKPATHKNPYAKLFDFLFKLKTPTSRLSLKRTSKNV